MSMHLQCSRYALASAVSSCVACAICLYTGMMRPSRIGLVVQIVDAVWPSANDRISLLIAVSQQEIEGLYKRFRNLDRGHKVGQG